MPKRRLFLLVLFSVVNIALLLWTLQSSNKNLSVFHAAVIERSGSNRTSVKVRTFSQHLDYYAVGESSAEALRPLAPPPSEDLAEGGKQTSQSNRENKDKRKVKFTRDLDDQNHQQQQQQQQQQQHENATRCPDIMSGMTRGRWITRPLTEQERHTIDTYLREERGAYKIPSTYQRDDGRCGDVPYKYSPLFHHMWFKAICDPYGSTPCCQTNKCVSLPEEECRCPTCYDERQAIHAEYASWKPEDKRCQVEKFTSEQACKLLRGTTIVFVGDSFVRHLFAALVIVLTNNSIDGALKKLISPALRRPCVGMHQITGNSCRQLLDQDRLLCNDTVTVKYVQVFPASEFLYTPPVLRSLRHVNKSIIVLGLGIHDDFDVSHVTKRFLLPFLNLRQHLSTNLTLDVDLNEVLTNFDSLDDLSGNFQDNSSKSSRDVSSKNSTSLYKYLLQRDLDQILGDIRLNVNQPNTLFSSFVAGLSKYGADFNLGFNLHGPDKEQLLRNLKSFKGDNHDSGTASSSITKGSNYNNKAISSIVNVTDSSIIFETLPKIDVDVNHLWPRLIWVGTHAPGLLKSPKFKEQTAEGVQNYNLGIQEILKKWMVPFLDTFTFSNGTVSFDGTHYGWGINMLKVEMLLTYIQRVLVQEEEWEW